MTRKPEEPLDNDVMKLLEETSKQYEVYTSLRQLAPTPDWRKDEVEPARTMSHPLLLAIRV